MQIVTAGQSIAGWFSPPPGQLTAADMRSWPQDDSELTLANRPGSFVVDTRTRGRSGDSVMWWDYGEPRKENTKDPHLLLATLADPQSTTASRFGSFRIEDTSDPQVIISLRFDPKAREPDRFRRYRASARLPSVYLRTITDEPAKSLSLVEHVQPLAPSFIQEIVDQLVGTTAGDLIKEWRAAPQGPVRRLKREKVGNRLSIHALEAGVLPDAHRRALLTRLRAALMSTRHTLDGETHTFWDWYALIAAEEKANSTNPALDTFTRLELAPADAKGFAYVISYLTAQSQFKGLLKGGVAGFSMRVRKVAVEFQLDANGARVTDSDGMPQLKDPKALEDETKGIKFGGGSELLIGFYGDIGAGLGMSLDSGLSESEGKPSAAAKAQGGGVLGGVTCYSDADLQSEDFDGAWFTITAIKGPGVKVGNFVGLDVFSSTFHQFSLRGGKVLSAVVTNRLQFKPPTLPAWDLAFGGKENIKSYVEGWTKGKGSVTLFEVSLGTGYVRRFGGVPTSDPPPPQFLPEYATLPGNANGVVLFDRDRAEFRVGSDIAQDSRYLLEVWLATMEALFTSANARISIDGYTSPEAPRCYNQQLSEARAQTIQQAILDAYEGGLKPAIFVSRGLGEIPALTRATPKLDDPPDDPPGRAAFELSHPDQVAHWPEWRKVEVAVNGTVVLIGRTDPP